ncbi:MAG: hypothetical protein J5496_08160 [Lachnospiraceae bacterium]|nr:hypothetical protein [Lachnospiraceae bacterium]
MTKKMTSLDKGFAALRNIAFLKNGTVEVADVLRAFGNIPLSDEEIRRIYDFMAAENIALADYEPAGTDAVNMNELVSETWGEADSEADRKLLDFYEEDLAGIAPLSRQEEENLTAALLQADAAARQAAAERLTEGNLRWVMQIAKDYAGRGLPLSDLIQEGNLALWESVSRFDGTAALAETLEKDIRGAIKTLLKEEGAYERTENQLVNLSNRILDTVKEMEEELGTAVTAAQISERLGIPEARVDEVLRQSAKAMKNLENG